MSNRARFLVTVSLSLLCAFPLVGQDADEEVSILKKDAAAEEAPSTLADVQQSDSEGAEKPKNANVDVSVGTKLYDAESVEELFQEYQAENERRTEQMAPHLNSDGLEIIELAPVQVDPYHVRNFDLLLEKIDPQPRRRLERLAELDPVAAAELQVSMRAEERFFAGENEATYDQNAGRPASVDFRKIGQSVSSALARARNAVREKKMTDDQDSLPVEGE